MSTMTPEQLRAECARLAEIPPWMISKGVAREAYAVAAQVPALLDENATLRQRIAELEIKVRRDAGCWLGLIEGRNEVIDGLEARVAELERDAARLDWADSCDYFIYAGRTCPLTARAAIDFAMQVRTKESGT